jgi:hypothetical protein
VRRLGHARSPGSHAGLPASSPSLSSRGLSVPRTGLGQTALPWLALPRVPARGQRRSPPAGPAGPPGRAPTGSGSWIRGQSFHSRSSA